MKKLIIICLLALTYISTYAQERTKQETMDWIASKIKAYPGGSTCFFRDNGDYINEKSKFICTKFENNILYLDEISEIREFLKISNRRTISKSITFHKIHLKKVIKIKLEPNSFLVGDGISIIGSDVCETKSYYEYDGESNKNLPRQVYYGVTYVVKDLNLKKHSEFSIFNEARPQQGLSVLPSVSIVDINSENNLKERMIKAFQTLANYNIVESPKEKF
jgi:hypothetical protein